MVKFLLNLFLLEALIFLQFLGNSSAASSCSDDSWIELPETSVSQLQSVVDASNATECQDKCLSNSSCVGIAWNANSSLCYFNLDPTNYGISYMNQSDITYYGLIRNYSTCDKDNYDCSWIGEKDNHGFQGSEVNRHDVIGCVQACQDNASCVAVDWNYQESSCWIFSGLPYTGAQSGIFHFVRNCTGSSPSPPSTKLYTPRISTVGPVTTLLTSTSTSAPVTSSSPAGPSTVASSSVSTSTVASSSSSVVSSLGSPTSTSGTTSTASSASSTSTGASTASTSTITPGTAATSSTPSIPAPNSSALALEVSEGGSDWYPLAIKPAYIVLAGVGGGCLLLVITAVVILCEYPLNDSCCGSSSAATKHVHAYQSQSPETTNYASGSREENVDMEEVEMELDKRPDGDAED